MRKSGFQWLNEANQRNYISAGLVNASDDDIVFFSDVDEIPSPEALKAFNPDLYDLGHMGELQFHYYLNFL